MAQKMIHMMSMDNTVATAKTVELKKNLRETMILFVFQKLTQQMIAHSLILIVSSQVMATTRSTSRTAGNTAMVMAEEEMTLSISQIFSTASIIEEIVETTIS